jgi:serine/threonine-protein kinase HipA
MAKACGIEMTESRLLEENDRAHFMTKRFDRKNGGEKIHMQTLCAIAHYDFNLPGAYSYELALDVTRKIVNFDLNIALEQLFRRAVFNIIGRNQDDHTKNISYLMQKNGKWSLSPAYDLTYSYNPAGDFTSKHQMSVNGKRDNFEKEDLMKLAEGADLSKAKATKIIEEVKDIFNNWAKYAQEANVSESHLKKVANGLRLNF